MNLMYENKEDKYKNSPLSATKPAEPVLDIKYKSNNELKTNIQQKKGIRIYDKDDKFYIDHATAFALGIVNTRAIMTDSPKLVELQPDMHNKLKSKDDIEIEYVKLKQKEKIKLFYDNSNCYIDMAAAYSLGLVSDEDFYNSDQPYYFVNNQILSYIKEKFNVEVFPLPIQEVDEENYSRR